MKALSPKRIRENNSRVLDYTSVISLRDQRIQLHGVGEKALCAYPGCHRFKDYYTGWDLENGMIQWGMVCATHDKQLGRCNLHKIFPFLSKREIVHLDGILDAACRDDLDEPHVRALLKDEGLAKCLTNAP
jgi:hypothetical protein